MKAPLFVRELAHEECLHLEAELRSKDAFVLRRCQILLASARKNKPSQIAKNLVCATQTVRNAIHAFNMHGLACLTEGSSRPRTTQPVLTQEKRDHLQVLLHHCPRRYGKNKSIWTLDLLAEVACEQGLSNTILSAPTLLDAVRRLGVSWKRAKHWISSSDPAHTRKKSDATDY